MRRKEGVEGERELRGQSGGIVTMKMMQSRKVDGDGGEERRWRRREG